MPHITDFDSIEQRLFALQHICYGGRQFCEHYKVDRNAEDSREYEWWEYYGLLKTTVSTTMIEAAIKLRMVQDFIQSEDQEIELTKLDEQATDGLTIGRFVVGGSKLTLRESCNKVVHATEAKLKWQEGSTGSGNYEYWDGTYRLWGSKGKDQWNVEIFVPEWCAAMTRLNKSVQEVVNWQSVSKWDE